MFEAVAESDPFPPFSGNFGRASSITLELEVPMSRSDDSHPYRTLACVVCAAAGAVCRACGVAVCETHGDEHARRCTAQRRPPIPDDVLSRAVAAWGYTRPEELAREETKARDARWNGIHSLIIAAFIVLSLGIGAYAGCAALAG